MCYATAILSDGNVYKVSRPLKASRVACETSEYVALVYFLPLKFWLKDAKFGSTRNLMNIQFLALKHIRLQDAELNIGTVQHALVPNPSGGQMPERACRF